MMTLAWTFICLLVLWTWAARMIDRLMEKRADYAESSEACVVMLAVTGCVWLGGMAWIWWPR